MKKVLALLSYIIANKGRGFFGSDGYFLLLLDPKYKYFNYYTLLHEYTHQFTNKLMKSNITINDKSQ